MKLSQAIRKGRKQVQGQYFGGWFAWDARKPRWRIDKYPPNVACPVGMALLSVGWKDWPSGFGAYNAAVVRWGVPAVQEALALNDKHRMRWDRIAARLAKAGW